MSVLDMFASALGAFIMCAIILFPYYHEIKYFEKNIEKTKRLSENLKWIFKL